MTSTTLTDACEKTGRLAEWCARKALCVWLSIRVHCDALFAHPRAYLVALWWRICRKRVRAHAQLAPLLGHSANAYRLWLLRNGAVPAQPVTPSPIVVLVDMTTGQHLPSHLELTLRSIAEQGLSAHLIGTDEDTSLASKIPLLDWQSDPWLMPIAPGDRLQAGAADAYCKAIQDRRRLIYADDDLLDRQGNRTAPHFKPAWNSELFAHFDFLTGACIIRATQADLAACSGQNWAARLTARVAGTPPPPAHLPLILHHRRTRPAPSIPARPAHVDQELPPVTVIIPTRNRADLLKTCLAGIDRTDYPTLDIIIVDNDSDEPESLAFLDALAARIKVLRHPGPFNFSAMNNRAAQLGQGRLLCLLNNDIEMIEPKWLITMAAQAMRDDVGAVGAHLLYPDGRTQHAGVVTGIGGGAAHAHRLLRPDEQGYFQRHLLPQFVSAVTAACLVVRRDRFMAVGGLDEANFAVAFNDVDFCLRLNQRGWQSFYEPRARLIHHESVSRGLDRDPVGARRLARELAALKANWSTDMMRDPFHHPNLSRFSERFVVQL